MSRIAGCSITLAAGLLLAGCTSSQFNSGSGGGAPTSHQIVYFLTGTAHSADLTLALSASGTSQQQGVSLPLTNRSGTAGLRFTAGDGQFLYISAQNNGGGSMTCRITEDGVTVASNTSSGQYTIVDCSASA